MRTYFIILSVLAGLMLACGCTNITSSPAAEENATPAAPTTTFVGTQTPQVQNYTFVQTITYSDENSTTVLTKNKLTKTAAINITALIAAPETEESNKTIYYRFGTVLTAEIMQMTFFNESAREQYNAQIQQWNSENYTVQDDSPAAQKETSPGEDPLAGYTVQEISIHMAEKETGMSVSDTVITGPDSDDLSISYP